MNSVIIIAALNWSCHSFEIQLQKLCYSTALATSKLIIFYRNFGTWIVTGRCLPVTHFFPTRNIVFLLVISYPWHRFWPVTFHSYPWPFIPTRNQDEYYWNTYWPYPWHCLPTRNNCFLPVTLLVTNHFTTRDKLILPVTPTRDKKCLSVTIQVPKFLKIGTIIYTHMQKSAHI